MFRSLQGRAWFIALNAALGAALATTSAHAQAPSQRIRACSLLTKAEVKAILPWRDLVDQMPVEEDNVGPVGSGCEYASVRIQVMPGSDMLEQVKKMPNVERVSGLGDEGYFRNNRNRYAEVITRKGTTVVTVQANVDKNMDVIRPKAEQLARLLLTKVK